MPIQNPLSIPGGWKKDTPRDTPAGEEPDPALNRDVSDPSTNSFVQVESQTIPRTPAGVVSETGGILDDAGETIGKVTESEDGRSLVGNTVTATGEVVDKTTGDVLGRASLESAGSAKNQEYTTGSQVPEDAQSQKSGSGIFGTIRSGLGYVGSIGSKKSDAGTNVAPSEAPKTQDLDAEKVQDTAKDATSEAPAESSIAEETPDELQDTTDDIQNKTDEAKDELAPEDSQSLGIGEDLPSQAGEISLKDREDDGEDKKTEIPESTIGENKSQSNLGLGEKGAEVQEGLDEAKSQSNLNVDEKGAEVQEGLEENKSQSNLNVDEKGSEIQEGLEETKSQSNLNLTEKGSDVPDVPEGQDAQDVQEGLEGAKSQSNLDLSEKGAEAQEGLEDIKSQADVNVPEQSEKDIDDKTTLEEQPEKDLEDKSALGDEAKLDDAPAEEATEAAEGVVPGEGEVAPEEKEEEKAEGEEEEEEGQKLDFTILKGCKVNKTGNLVNDNGDVVGHVVEGDPKKLQGKRSDEEGNIWNDAGKIVGKAEPLSDGEREDRKKTFAPFENFPDAVVEADGRVMSEGRQVGTVVEGDPKRLKGSKVDEDGDILDRNGNTVGRAEAWDEPEPIPEEPEEIPDRSILAGKRVNKAGNVVDSAGTIFGKVVEGNVSAIVGRMCDKDGNIRSESGDIVGRAEVVPEGEREGSKEGPFAELSGLTVRKDGMVVTPSDEVVGRLTSGDPKKLFGRSVDEDGDVVDKNGNVLGKAERYEEPEEVVEEKKKGPLFGRKVNKEGNVVDEDGNVIAKLVSGDLLVCSGKEIDDDGDVINSKGNTVGHVALIEDIPEPEPEPEEETETEEQRKEREQAETDRKLAGQLAGCIEQSLEKIKPICKLITNKIDTAERTPKEELDEEQLVREVKPLIEEGGKLLSETNGIVRGLDPDGRIQRQSKQRSGTKEATPEEHHLAEVLKELTGDVSQTVDNAKRKIEGMPHAKKELNPLWGLLMEPLGQILAAVGLLLTGVLGLVGRLLSGLGLGGIVDGLLGGLGLNKILGSLGLGSAYDALVGKNQKKK